MSRLDDIRTYADYRAYCRDTNQDEDEPTQRVPPLRMDPATERIPQTYEPGFTINLADWSDRQMENLLMDMRYGPGASVLIRQIADMKREESEANGR